MNNFNRLMSMTVSCIAVSSVMAAPAGAQSGAATESATKDEIVVTALRREQRLQDVPASISVLGADSIQAKNAQDFRDYLTTVPGVNFSEGALGGMRVTIRGVSDGIGGSDPLAGIYIDETPITESFFATLDPDVFDIERVEVLRGPQGTLYGASSMGGTVRVITKKPKLDTFEGTIAASGGDVAHGGWNRRVDGVVNVPVVEDLIAFRASAGYRKDDGWIDNVSLGEDDVNVIEKSNVRAQVLVQPSPDTSIVLGFLYQNEDLGLFASDDVSLPDYQAARLFAPYSDSDAKLVSLTLNQAFDNMALTSATNYLTKDVDSGSDVAALRNAVNFFLGVSLGPDEALGSLSTNEFTLFTQEVRLASTGDNLVDYVVGGFFSDGTSEVFQTFDFTQAPTAAAVQSGEDFSIYDQEYRTRQVAGFGELTFNATDWLSLTAGLRVFNVEQTTVTVADGTLNGGSSTQIGESDATAVQQKYLIEFQPSESHLVYAQASQGYRNGAPTGNGLTPACAAELAMLGYSSFPTAYDPDKLWNYEIGSKNTLLDGRMTLNAAAYYIDWTDMQTSVRLTSCNSGFVANAGKAVSKGFEMETAIQPVDGLTVNGGLAFADAELDEPAPGATGVSAGDPLPQVSRWSWNVSAEYRQDITANVNAFIRGEVNHVGSRWSLFRSAGPAAVLMDPYTLVNARVGVGGDHWSLSLFATNLFDERNVLLRVAGSNPYDLVGRPRVIGVSTRLDF